MRQRRDPHPSPSADGLGKAPSRDTLPDLRGPMVRFESDQKTDSPRERAVLSN
jgi:hypothetical protein